MADFAERMRTLSALVGDGPLYGEVAVNQVYAHYQDSGIGPPQHPHIPAAEFHHPRGGEAGYLSETFAQRWPIYLQWCADAVTEEAPMAGKMVAAMVDLVGAVHEKAPREYWVLRNSASALVLSNGRIYLDLPALIGRLSQGELNAIRREGGDNYLHEGELQHESRYASGSLTQATRHRRRRVFR